ncbi:DUF3581 family protein [Arenicella xantha]|uniref:Uncharacterized protein DUF3581 n=1 Tax=Arenicella xantha TaxID=644221 RepID=A0A395JG00_9GAMM|nr:DUF3581 family protein [Arenicella xantha]RBP48702.1 uncharacterized protein DUF3581 [Arenicella xantha]
MSFLDPYHSSISANQIQVSADQGSQFAKQVAGDYNPIHDPDSSRFCVPGDLLFALTLQKYGIHTSMGFQFLELVAGDAILNFPEVEPSDEVSFAVENERAKPVMAVQYQGDAGHQQAQIESVIREYVAFSGRNFPHILLPLIKQHDVMVNPKRPLVIYERMSFELDHLDFDHVELELSGTELEVTGKRGRAILEFVFKHQGAEIGTGSKVLVLSGLRPYEEAVMNQVRDDYLARVNAEQ